MKTPYYQTAPQMIDTTHASVAYWKVGQGPDLVFFHGWPLSSITYRGIVEKLSGQFTCHLFDFPGAGKTIDKGYVDVSVIVQSVKELIAKIGLTRYVCIAHDSGALVARLIAQDNPSVVGLVMGNTEIPGHHSALVQILAKISKIPGGIFALRQIMKIRRVRTSGLGFQGAFRSREFIEGEFSRLVLSELLSSSKNLTRALSLLGTFDFSEVDRLGDVHQKIKAPVHFIWGRQDRIFPLDKARGMMSQFSGGASLDIIEGGRCFAHEEFAEQFALYAQPFLEGLLKPTAQRDALAAVDLKRADGLVGRVVLHGAAE